MGEYENAAIIGHWRNGATIEQIMWITDIYYDTIETIINDYQRTKEIQS